MANSKTTRNGVGGSNAVTLIKDRAPIIDPESGEYICGEKLGTSLLCKGIPISPRNRCRRHGGSWKATAKALAKPDKSIYDTHRLWKGYHNIRKELTAHPEFVDQLYTTDLSEELAVSRLVLAEVLRLKDVKTNENPDNEQREMILKVLSAVRRIAKSASDIQDKKNEVIKQDFMDGIIVAVTHAFIRSNRYERQEDRARVFASEFASMLPGNINIDIPQPGDIIEGEAVIKV